MEGNGLVEIHDLLVAMKPGDHEHGPANCGICAEKAGLAPPKEEIGMTTYTEEQLQAKLVEATAPMEARLAELEKAASEGEVDAKIAEATAPLNDKIAELETSADTMTAELNAVKAERDELVQANVERDSEAEKAQLRAARMEDRKAKAAEFFTDEQIAERADRWADMEDAAFDQLLEDVKVLAGDGGNGDATTTVRPSALTAADTRPVNRGSGGMSDTARNVLSRRRGRLVTNA